MKNWVSLWHAYRGTKFALEKISESKRYETEPFGIKVELIEPGVIRTKQQLGMVHMLQRLKAALGVLFYITPYDI